MQKSRFILVGLLINVQTRASSAQMTIPYPFPLPVTNNSGPQCLTNKAPITINIEVDPDPSEIGTFSAPGLSLGGRATWKYLHIFQATYEVP